MRRVLDAWRELTPEQRLAGVASVALFVTMFMPWYQQNAVVSAHGGQPLVSRNLDAFAVFSFVEAAVLLVAAAIMALLFARAEHRTFQLPGSDGAIVMVAGAWAALLLIWRLFDKPGIASHGVAGNVGVQWGIFFALAAAGLLIYAGSRMRATRRPEAPVLRGRRAQPGERPGERPTELDEEPTVVQASRRPRSDQEDRADLAQAGGDRSQALERPRHPPAPATAAPSTAGARALRTRRATGAAELEQLSFEDGTPEPGEPPSGTA
jgi:hypothetical protein